MDHRPPGGSSQEQESYDSCLSITYSHPAHQLDPPATPLDTSQAYGLAVPAAPPDEGCRLLPAASMPSPPAPFRHRGQRGHFQNQQGRETPFLKPCISSLLLLDWRPDSSVRFNMPFGSVDSVLQPLLRSGHTGLPSGLGAHPVLLSAQLCPALTRQGFPDPSPVYCWCTSQVPSMTVSLGNLPYPSLPWTVTISLCFCLPSPLGAL